MGITIHWQQKDEKAITEIKQDHLFKKLRAYAKKNDMELGEIKERAKDITNIDNQNKRVYLETRGIIIQLVRTMLYPHTRLQRVGTTII